MVVGSAGVAAGSVKVAGGVPAPAESVPPAAGVGTAVCAGGVVAGVVVPPSRLVGSAAGVSPGGHGAGQAFVGAAGAPGAPGKASATGAAAAVGAAGSVVLARVVAGIVVLAAGWHIGGAG